MAILKIFDQTERDSLNYYLDAMSSGWEIETFITPTILGRADKPFSVRKNNLSRLLDMAALRYGSVDAGLITLANNLEEVSYNYPLWGELDGLPPDVQLPLAPLGQWKFVLEGSSSASGKFMTVATKAGIPSNLTPAILPANLHVVSMFWMNEIDGANEVIEFYLNETLVNTWVLAGARWAVLNEQNEFNPLMVLPESGLLSAKITNQSSPVAKDGYVELVFRLVGNATPGEIVSATL